MLTSRTKLNDNQVIKEMLDTEVSYNTTLTSLEATLCKETLAAITKGSLATLSKDALVALTLAVLPKEALDALSQEALAALCEEALVNNPLLIEFRDQITILKAISDQLITNAITAINVEIDDTVRNTLRVQRTQLLKAFYTVYPTYAGLYDQFAAGNRINKQLTGAIDDHLVKTNLQKLDLASHLITPVQRGPRYKMLIEATEKLSTHLDEAHRVEFIQLKELSTECLKQANSIMAPPKKPWFGGYQVGDLTRYFVTTYITSNNNTDSAPKEQDVVKSEIIIGEETVPRSSNKSPQ